MESLAFVAGVAILLVALHVVVAAYLFRATLSGEGQLLDREPASDERPPRHPDAAPDVADDAVSCPTCGVPNDPSYQFCRNCVADLTGKQRTTGGAPVGRLGS